MQRFRRPIDSTIRNKLVLEHFIVYLGGGKMRKEGPARQNMVEHLRASMMQYGKAPVGRQCPLHRCQHAARQMS